jgi:glycerol-3-phosphate dehydrogenase (NAD(P)+)
LKIAIIGAGSWGTTLANLLAENNSDDEVIIWAMEEEVSRSINENNENTQFLPGKSLSDKLKATSDLSGAVDGAKILVAAIPSQFLRGKAKEINQLIKGEVTIVNVAKGLEISTFKRMSEVISEEIPDAKIAVLSGPNHAEEVSKKIPTATVIASLDADLEQLKRLFNTSYFKVYPHDDIIGLEVCGAIKNITAIATGVISGLGLGDNALGSIITLGLREMVFLGKEFGAKQETFYGLAGVGDLVATCASKHSRNRKAGTLLAKGMHYDEIKKEMHGMIAEGIMTCKAVHDYSQDKGFNLHLTSQVYKVLFEEKELSKAIEDLKELI